MVKYFVDFTGTRGAALLRACGLHPGRVSEVFPALTLQPLWDELIRVGMTLRPQSRALCAKLLECVALRTIGAQAPIEGAEALAHTTYRRCLQYLEEHCLRLQTLEQIAAECHVNDAYLCRLFRRYEQPSPYQYLLRLKMNQAARRLQESHSLIKQVAAEVGFADPLHFSRAFKSVVGLSPNSFRRIR